MKEDIATRKFAIYLLTKDVHIYQIYRKEIMSIHGTFLCNSLFLNQNTRKAFFQVQGQPYFTCLYLPCLIGIIKTNYISVPKDTPLKQSLGVPKDTPLKQSLGLPCILQYRGI